MDAKMIIALAIVTAICLVPNGTQAWRRRRWNRIFKPICSLACGPVCTAKTGQAVVCTTVCHNVCKGKRSAEIIEKKLVDPDFTKYDEDADGFIVKQEWNHFWNSNATDTGVDEVFKYADVDGDGKLNPEEFLEGPFEFEEENDEFEIDN